ncbi:hypothetical protein GGQ64_003458 [Rhizobium azooxidifex]|uniref:YkgJ family cysteine cluster protein n=1 Tax=Mycoplana azooxidifex TaxID=1636188 RepID=A0A7W6DFW3_9HYPH|nr:hypothetical protein [Mycoplana azooxidifex]MBB3978224.1 hypothetical protein [Mycoplana azooxidifex]
MDIQAPSSPGRSCGTCTLCCRLPDIDALSKPANAWCQHCRAEGGCTIYQDRPQVCRDFLCLWMVDDALGQEWEPARSHMMIYRQGPQVTVLVDPAHAAVWRREPYYSRLETWAKEAEADHGYVIVFAGDDVFKI